MSRALPVLVRVLLLSLVALLLPTGAADAAVDVELVNGGKLTGTLEPTDEREIVRVTVPAGAALTVVAQGKRTKGAAAPQVTFRVLDDGNVDLAAGSVAVRGSTGAVLKKLPIAASGVLRVEVRTANGVGGTYQIKVKWKSPTKAGRTIQLDGDEVPVEIAADAGSTATIVVKRTKGSAALPRILRIEPSGGGDPIAVAQPDAAATKHVARGLLLGAGGDYTVVFGNVGGNGAAKATIKLKPAKVDKRPIAVTSGEIGAPGDGDGTAIGAVFGTAGGEIAFPAEDATGLGGAGIVVPESALRRRTALVIGTAPSITDGPEEGLRGVGPTVFCGPDGLRFDASATVTLPFDAGAFGGDTGSLVVVSRDARGRERVVDAELDVDGDAETVSFPVTRLATYRAFGRLPPVRGDLNGDGIGDYVYTDLSATVGVDNRVVVVFGSASLASRAIGATDLVFQETTQDTSFGEALATGDVNGDGVEDLIVTDRGSIALSGQVYVFFGGPDLTGTDSPRIDADIVLQGPVTGARFGYRVAVGNLVGDGVADIAVSARYVGFGDSTPDVTMFEGGKNLVTRADPVARIAGPVAVNDEGYGGNLVIADVTGDKKPDLLISSSRANVPEFSTGAIYVFAGPLAFTEALRSDATATLTGTDEGEQFGVRVAAGDVTGDGTADIVAATNPPGLTPNDVFVFAGGPALTDGATTSAVVTIAGDDTTVTKRLAWELLVADLDDDGTDDVIVSDSLMPDAAETRGGVAVFKGGAGLASGVVATADVIVRGTVDMATFGHAVTAGDVTGDGVPELFIRTFDRVRESDVFESAAFVFAGPGLPPATDLLADVVLTGLLVR